MDDEEMERDELKYRTTLFVVPTFKEGRRRWAEMGRFAAHGVF